MTPEEYRETLAALELSQLGAARLLGVNDRTARRWALGEAEIPPPAARFLLFLRGAKIPPDRVLKVLARPAE